MSIARTPAPDRSGVDVLSWIGGLFTLKPEKFNPALGIAIAVILFVPLLVLNAVGRVELWLGFSFAVLFTALSDVVVRDIYPTRLRRAVAFVLVGTLLTALGVILGGANWLLVTLAVLVSTLLSFLAAGYSLYGFVAGALLNAWFLVALASSLSQDKSPAQAWPLAGPQALTWLAGGVLWLVVICLGWLARGTRQSVSAAPPQGAAVPGWSRSLLLFAGLATLAVALATAVAWGFDLPNAVWMPVAALGAIKPGLAASAYRSGQRVAGTVIGGIVAALVLMAVHNAIILAIIVVVVAAVGAALHEVNYALYSLCISTVVLIGLDLSQRGGFANIWERIAWTLAGVGLALVAMFLATWSASQRAPTA